MRSVRNPDNCSTLGVRVGSSSTSAFCSSTRVFEGGNLPASEPRASRDFALVTSLSRVFAYYLRAPVTGGGLTARAPW